VTLTRPYKPTNEIKNKKTAHRPQRLDRALLLHRTATPADSARSSTCLLPLASSLVHHPGGGPPHDAKLLGGKEESSSRDTVCPSAVRPADAAPLFAPRPPFPPTRCARRRHRGGRAPAVMPLDPLPQIRSKQCSRSASARRPPTRPPARPQRGRLPHGLHVASPAQPPRGSSRP